MRVALISHSNAHQRQMRFAEELGKHCEVLCLAPSQWGMLYPENLGRVVGDGFVLDHARTVRSGDLYNFVWGEGTYLKLCQFKPDVVFCASEWGSQAADQVRSWCVRRAWKFVLFTWENLRTPSHQEGKFLEACDGIVAGNRDARIMCWAHNCRVALLPQVGVDTDLFKPAKVRKEWDVLCVGRNSAQKGVDTIRKAWPETRFVSDEAYEDLPGIYNRAKLHVTFPQSSKDWKEQSMGYVTAEAMSCGLQVLTSDCGAIPEYLNGGRARIVSENLMHDALCIEILHQLRSKTAHVDGLANRDFILKRYSNVVVAKKLFAFLKKVVEE